MPTKSKKTNEPVIVPIEPEVIEEPVFEEQPEDVLVFKRSHFYSVLTVLAFAIGILVGYVVWGFGSDGSQNDQGVNPPSNAAAPATAESQFVRYDIPSEGFPFIGPEDAPITIVEFSDYQCPFCRRWHAQVYEPLLAAYPGKIKLVYRHLPLTSIHPDAFTAAEAAMCAGEQDAYWPYHEKLFSSDDLSSAALIQYAQDLSLNVENFKTCMTEQKYRAEIEADSNFATDLGVSSTPTFFINGLAIVGAQPLDIFKQVIDKELAGEIPQ